MRPGQPTCDVVPNRVEISERTRDGNVHLVCGFFAAHFAHLAADQLCLFNSVFSREYEWVAQHPYPKDQMKDRSKRKQLGEGVAAKIEIERRRYDK